MYDRSANSVFRKRFRKIIEVYAHHANPISFAHSLQKLERQHSEAVSSNRELLSKILGPRTEDDSPVQQSNDEDGLDPSQILHKSLFRLAKLRMKPTHFKVNIPAYSSIIKTHGPDSPSLPGRLHYRKSTHISATFLLMTSILTPLLPVHSPLYPMKMTMITSAKFLPTQTVLCTTFSLISGTVPQRPSI